MIFKLISELFSSVVTTNAKAGLIVATNQEDETLLANEYSGKELECFTLGSQIRLARIITAGSETAGSLFILTADQIVHRLPLRENVSSHNALSHSPVQ